MSRVIRRAVAAAQNAAFSRRESVNVLAGRYARARSGSVSCRRYSAQETAPSVTSKHASACCATLLVKLNPASGRRQLNRNGANVR